jgi:hypothetical protein
MTTTQERYAAAVATVRAAGVTVRLNVRAATRGSVTADQLGTTPDMLDSTPYAWTYGSQGGRITWRDGEPYSGYAYERLVREARRRPWILTPERLTSCRAQRAFWYHGGPGGEAAQQLAYAFRAQGFEVEWNGTPEQAVSVKLPVDCDCMPEANPYDQDGPDLVLTHSTTCRFHPEYDGPLVTQ